VLKQCGKHRRSAGTSQLRNLAEANRNFRLQTLALRCCGTYKSSPYRISLVRRSPAHPSRADRDGTCDRGRALPPPASRAPRAPASPPPSRGTGGAAPARIAPRIFCRRRTTRLRRPTARGRGAAWRTVTLVHGQAITKRIWRRRYGSIWIEPRFSGSGSLAGDQRRLMSPRTGCTVPQ
jgi:hypothetical protein